MWKILRRYWIRMPKQSVYGRNESNLLIFKSLVYIIYIFFLIKLSFFFFFFLKQKKLLFIKLFINEFHFTLQNLQPS